jgi:hypothetical protein
VDEKVSWDSFTEHSVRGTFSHAGNTIRATLIFDSQGYLVNFVSHDRFLSADGQHYEQLPWSTPLGEYHDFGGRKVPTRGQAVLDTIERWLYLREI